MLDTYKIGGSDFAGKDVSSLPDQPGSVGMTASELKAAFDRPVKEVVVPKMNALIDALEAQLEKGAYTVTEYAVSKRTTSYVTSNAFIRKIGRLAVMSGELICPAGFPANEFTTAAVFDTAVAPMADLTVITSCENSEEYPEPAALQISTQGTVTVFPNSKTYVVQLCGVWILPEETA